MNSNMREIGPNEPSVQERIDATNRGLDQLPSYDGTTYRATNLPDAVVDHINNGGNSQTAPSPAAPEPERRGRLHEPRRDNPTSITDAGPFGHQRRPLLGRAGRG